MKSQIPGTNTKDEVMKLRSTRDEVAANFQLAASTVQSIIEVFDQENRIALKSQGGDKRFILNEQHKEFLEAAIEEEP
ncbi:2245_t:CDS:2 [Cetraspora pellucida]|uniref:2245_t:CDS:1 n=1 Tax=Cetraspora pellucida TaxID=1433469 RepID=A0A9N9HHV0_9GLOM|nr:2245_t:CDS:2 [Cetraspora pellucida]